MKASLSDPLDDREAVATRRAGVGDRGLPALRGLVPNEGVALGSARRATKPLLHALASAIGPAGAVSASQKLVPNEGSLSGAEN